MSAKVHWLDAFPDEWAVVPAKRLFTESKIRAEITDEQLTASQDYGVIPQKEFIRRAGRSVVQINQHLDKRKRVEKDDFVISMRSFQGGLERAWASGGIRSSYVVLKPSPAVDVGYFARLFKSQQYIQALQATAHFIRDGQDLSFQNFTLVDLPLPPLDQQTQIAKFLDYETAKIDALIAKQQQLIALLQEKRQAVISHAVTKGLNPDAPLCDSGVEWLGMVPAHWEVAPIKYQFESLDSKRIPLSTTERGERQGVYPYYGASGVIDYIDDFIFNEPTILVGEDGANLVNRSTPLAFPAFGQYWVNNHAHILRPPDEAIHYWTEAIEHIDVNPLVTGAAQPKLTAEALLNLKIAFAPSREERLRIQEFILEQKTKLLLLAKTATDAVELLQERRTALIAAAVTGKIDVSGWQPPHAEAAGARP